VSDATTLLGSPFRTPLTRQTLDETTRGQGGFGSTGGFGPAAKKQKLENGGAVETVQAAAEAVVEAVQNGVDGVVGKH
jgi:hypothetical protein